VKPFDDPHGENVDSNDHDYPIPTILSSYYFADGNTIRVPHGKSVCKACKKPCEECETQGYAKPRVDRAVACEGKDCTCVHREPQILAAMQHWMRM
jgi:hypothetical protein